MPTFEIPAGPPVSKNTHVAKQEACPEDPATTMQRGSITYNHTKGGMTCEWDNDAAFLAWHATEECEKGMSSLQVSSSIQVHSFGGSDVCSGACVNAQVGSGTTNAPLSQTGRSSQRKQAASVA